MPTPRRRAPIRRRRSATATPTVLRDARIRLLESALDMFAEHGFDGATTRDIAAGAGVNLGLVQYYFGGKERLWRAAVDHAFATLWAALETAGPGAAAGPDGPAETIRIAVRFAAGQPALVRLMNDEGKREGPRLRWLVERHGRRLYAVAAGLTGAGAQGVLDGVAPVHLYYAFIGAAGLIFSQAAECRRLTGVDPTTSPALIEAHAELVARLFLGPAGRRTARR